MSINKKNLVRFANIFNIIFYVKQKCKNQSLDFTFFLKKIMLY